jgi:hypothetical protein
VCPSQLSLRYGCGPGISLVVVINCTKSSIATLTISVISMTSASPRSTGGSGKDIRGQRVQPSWLHSDPGGIASTRRTGSDVGSGGSGRGYGENDKTPRGSIHGVLR